MIIDLSDRKKQILDAIISDYIDTAEPVGSFTITHHYVRNFSPATIRAEMSELEHIGYITHPHTSSGRIPTDFGYRYYVDNIMETKTISGREISLIRNGIKKIGRGIEEILHGTVKLISSVLDYVTVFVSFGKENNKVYASGISNILKQPEFNNITQARRFMETIEHEDFLTRILAEYSRNRDLNIQIGHENRHREMQDLSVVVAKHKIYGINPGAIGIIGPTRMDYNRVTSVLNFISQELATMEREVINVRGD
jgi:transcriptional regulator of heat shock response